MSCRHHHDSSKPNYDSPRSSYDQAQIHVDLRRWTRIHPDFTATHPDLTTIYPDLPTIYLDLITIYPDLAAIRTYLQVLTESMFATTKRNAYQGLHCCYSLFSVGYDFFVRSVHDLHLNHQKANLIKYKRKNKKYTRKLHHIVHS
jgi:hypothetical protein